MPRTRRNLYTLLRAIQGKTTLDLPNQKAIMEAVLEWLPSLSDKHFRIFRRKFRDELYRRDLASPTSDERMPEALTEQAFAEWLRSLSDEHFCIFRDVFREELARRGPVSPTSGERFHEVDAETSAGG